MLRGSHQRRQGIDSDTGNPVHHQGPYGNLPISKIGNQQRHKVAAELIGILNLVPQLLLVLALKNGIIRGLQNLAVLIALRNDQGGNSQELNADTGHPRVLAANHAVDLGNRCPLDKIGDLVIGRILGKGLLKSGDGGIKVAFLELGETLLEETPIFFILGFDTRKGDGQQADD